MRQDSFFVAAVLVLVLAMHLNGFAQSVFRVGAWCLQQPAPALQAVYQLPSGEWRVFSNERDRLLNLGLNYFIACSYGLNAEDALVFMGDSLDAAPVRKEFESTLEIVQPGGTYFPPGHTYDFYQVWRRSRTAELYPSDMAWVNSVVVGYDSMYVRHAARIDGVHSFIIGHEGGIRQNQKIAGLNFMGDNTNVESFILPNYYSLPGDTLSPYAFAKRVVRADHLTGGGYYLTNATPYTGPLFQAQIDTFVASLRHSARGIRDTTSSTRLWVLVQTQFGTNGLRLPTKDEVLCQVNLALAHGVKGIIYYLYSSYVTHQPPPLLPSYEIGLLDTTTRTPTAQYTNVQDINTNYQGTGQSLVNIGSNFLNLTWKEDFSIHQNTNEPINSTYKLYDVTAKIPGGATDAETETYVETGVLQSGSTNHYMVVNRRCTSTESREVTLTFQSTSTNAYLITDVFTGDQKRFLPANAATITYTFTLGPGQGKLLKLEDLGNWTGTISSNTTWSGTVCVNANATVTSAATLTLSSGTTVIIAPTATLTVQGALSMPTNATISGGGKIVTSGSGVIYASTSTLATALNNSRKMARDASGNYHVVFDAGGEISYEKWTNSGTELREHRRLSAGTGNNAYACVAERGGRLYVVWQRNDGGTYDVHFSKSTDGGTTWNTSTELFSNVSQSLMLPVITSAATNKLMAACRGASTLRHRTSDDDGVSWMAEAAVPGSNSIDGYPTLALTTSNSGGAREVLVWSRTGSPSYIYYRYYMHGPDSTGWSGKLRNLSQIVPGTYTAHQRPSIAQSGTSTNKQLHVVWEANGPGSVRVIIHRKATNWYTWPSVYSVTYDNINQQQLPNITGLANATAVMLFRLYSQNQVYKMDYDGSMWCGAVSVGQGVYPSVSTGYTSAKYVWTAGTASPYQIKLSSETLSNISSCASFASTEASQNNLSPAYHRSVAVLDTTANAWLELRLDKLSVKTHAGEELLLPFVTAQEDSLTLTPSRAFVNLASSSLTLPAEAESLFVSYLVGAQRLSSLKSGSVITLSLAFTGKKDSRSLPLLTTTSDSISVKSFKLATRISSFANDEVSLRTMVLGLDDKATIIASLGHIYEITSQSFSKDPFVHQMASPRDFEIRIHPNPFNPSTQIHFYLPTENLVAVRIYDVNGRTVKELANGFRAAGEHSITWDGRDELGREVASGMYFSHVSVGEERQVAKMVLVR